MNRDMRGVMGLSAAHLVIDLYSPVLPAVLPLLIADQGYSFLMGGLLVTAYNLTSSMAQPPIGWLFDRRGKGIHIGYSLILSATFISLIGIAPEFSVLALFAMLAALGHATFHPSALASVGTVASDVNRGRLMSYFVVGGNLGYAIGPLLAGVVVAAMGLQGLLALLVPGYAMAILLHYILPAPLSDRPAPLHPIPDAPTAPIRPVPIVTLLFAAGLRAWAIFGAVAYLPTYLVLQGFDLVAANTLVTLMLVAGVGGQILGGTLSDRYGRKEFSVLGLALAIPAFLLFIATDGIVSVVFMLTFGFLLWSTFAVTVAMGQELLPGNIGLASGLTLGLAVGGGGIGVAVTGSLADLVALDTALALLAVPIAASLLLFIVLPYPWKSLKKPGA
ncbi:MAG: MFS transporter [Methanomicrobiales archaeon]|nr:MFS transporter [Methanomicrobiales archaeon]MDI6875378.1 MFS transporter [Methanomicrobiales archaeon]